MAEDQGPSVYTCFPTWSHPRCVPELHINRSGEIRSQREMTASPGAIDRDKTARQTPYTVCY
jgi:hypothetical protein